MESLPSPATVECRRHVYPVPIDILFPWTPRKVDGMITPLYPADVACQRCCLESVQAGEYERQTTLYHAHREIRRRVSLPTGTLLVHRRRGDERLSWSADLSMLTYWVAVPSWDTALPLKALDLSTAPMPVVFVCLAALVAADAAPRLKQLFWGDWFAPHRPYRTETLGWDAPRLKHANAVRIADMIQLFREFDPETIGRPCECYAEILATIRRVRAAGDEPRRARIADLLYGANLVPENGLKACIRRERERTGRRLRWPDVVREAD